MKLEVKTEELQKQRLFIGTPMYGGQCTGLYTKSTNDLSMLCSSHKIPMKYYFLFNESLVQRARNYIVDEFMRSDCTHLLFIDSDIVIHKIWIECYDFFALLIDCKLIFAIKIMCV